MKKKISFAVLLVIALGVYLVFLPEKQNVRMRYTLAEELYRCKLVESWFKRGEQKRQIVEEAAKKRSQGKYVVAKVVFRPLSTYMSSLWIERGKDCPLIKKNSPVLSGDTLIGVVEYVGDRASLVRLITDSAVCPSVRVRRGQQTPPLFLAKGTLQGYGESLWRSSYPLLKGFEFNYDFKDFSGPARDLRTGEPYDPKEEYPPEEPHPLVLVGDLLVTTGMDGVFPEGLKVAYVSSILPLTEGAYSYDLIASCACKELDDLEYVTVIPPVGFDFSQIPNRLDRVLDQITDE
jgi:rod shape-determining protein MreC